MDLLILLILALVGVLAGAASGLFGVGGGIIVVPALVLLADLSFRDAVAASLIFIVLTSPLGVFRHWKHGNVDFRQGVVLGITGVIGVLLGELVGRGLTDRQLILGFAALLLFSAQHLVYGRIPQARHPSLAVLTLVGVFAGLVAKLFGIGGGIIVVPALVFIGLTIHRAVGTSLVSVFLNAVVASGINLSQGTGWLLWSLAPAAGSLIGIQWGVGLGARMNPVALRQSFAILLILVGLDLARRAFA